MSCRAVAVLMALGCIGIGACGSTEPGALTASSTCADFMAASSQQQAEVISALYDQAYPDDGPGGASNALLNTKYRCELSSKQTISAALGTTAGGAAEGTEETTQPEPEPEPAKPLRMVKAEAYGGYKFEVGFESVEFSPEPPVQQPAPVGTTLAILRVRIRNVTPGRSSATVGIQLAVTAPSRLVPRKSRLDRDFDSDRDGTSGDDLTVNGEDEYYRLAPNEERTYTMYSDMPLTESIRPWHIKLEAGRHSLRPGE